MFLMANLSLDHCPSAHLFVFLVHVMSAMPMKIWFASKPIKKISGEPMNKIDFSPSCDREALYAHLCFHFLDRLHFWTIIGARCGCLWSLHRSIEEGVERAERRDRAMTSTKRTVMVDNTMHFLFRGQKNLIKRHSHKKRLKVVNE